MEHEAGMPAVIPWQGKHADSIRIIIENDRKDQATPFGGVQAYKDFRARPPARGEYREMDLPWPDGR